MIPAVEDFTQKVWAQQQAALLQQQRAEAAAAAEEPIPTDSEYEGAAAADAAAAAGDGQLELLGKLLVTPEQLREKISVSDTCRTVCRVTFCVFVQYADVCSRVWLEQQVAQQR
jgi:hypothetical protein